MMSAVRSPYSDCAEYATPAAAKVDTVARSNSTRFRGKRIAQPLFGTNTKKPVRITLKAMQIAAATIAGPKSDATAAVSDACQALQIKKLIIAKYEAIITSTNRSRKTPDPLAVGRSRIAPVFSPKPAPCPCLSAAHFFAIELTQARQRLTAPSNAFSR
jgi:hypothetical protein